MAAYDPFHKRSTSAVAVRPVTSRFAMEVLRKIRDSLPDRYHHTLDKLLSGFVSGASSLNVHVSNRLA